MRFFCSFGMEDASRIRDDAEFCERLKEYWDFDEEGRRFKIKKGWKKAQAEYERIVGLKKGSKQNDLGF